MGGQIEVGDYPVLPDSQMVLALLRGVRGVERPPPRPVPSAEAQEPHVPAVVDVLLELFVWNAME